MKEKEKNLFIVLSIGVVLIFLLSTFTSCVSLDPKEKPDIPKPILTRTPEPIQTNLPKVVLSWENTTAPHPERSPWSQALYAEINSKFSVLDTVKDMARYCPSYRGLTIDQRKMAWAEFFVALAYYECGFKEDLYSVDVGQKGDYSTYSVGLFQMSAVDIKNYGLKGILPDYTFEDLKKYGPNIKLALAIFEKQVKSQALICVSKNVYWATLSCRSFAKYEVNDEIAARLQKKYPKCK